MIKTAQQTIQHTHIFILGKNEHKMSFPTGDNLTFGAQKCLLWIGQVWFKSGGKSNSMVQKTETMRPPSENEASCTNDIGPMIVE